jgi:hypothetical protein
MVGVEFARQPALDHAKQAKHRERRDCAKDGGHPKSYANKNADGGGHPYRSGGGEAAHGQSFLEDCSPSALTGQIELIA